MFKEVTGLITSLNVDGITLSRKHNLNNLTAYIQEKVHYKATVNLNFICTHNSRRSHLGQVWAQTLAAYYKIPSVKTYSGGTVATALFPKIAATLNHQGFQVEQKGQQVNPNYYISFSDSHSPVHGFSKVYDHKKNPKDDFAAIMTCDSANEACPLITGADHRIAITYIDPKSSDGTPQQDQVYRLKSLEIATELKYVFSQIKL